jgi:hypothetical protein
MTSRSGGRLFVAYVALLFFGLGAAMLESFLNYPMWRDLGTRMTNDDFVANRRAHEWRIYPLLVVPLLLRVPVTLALLWRRPDFVPRWVVLAALAVQVVGWSSSAVIQIPIQMQLTHEGFSDAQFARLIVTDLWLRAVPFWCEVAVGVVLMLRAADRLNARASRAEPHTQPKIARMEMSKC